MKPRKALPRWPRKKKIGCCMTAETAGPPAPTADLNITSDGASVDEVLVEADVTALRDWLTRWLAAYDARKGKA